MAMKPEPMEYEGDGAQVYPLQMVQNETQMQMEQNIFRVEENKFNSGLGFAQCTAGKIRPKHNRQHSAVSDILLGTGRRQAGGKLYQNSHLQPYTIARGEIELNSKFLPKKYKCGMCAYKSSYKSDLNRHMRRHANNKEVPYCRYCETTFASTSALVLHSTMCPQLSGPETSVRYQCEVCPYTSSCKPYLTQHMKNHSTHQFACDVCFKPFKVLGMLDQHRQSVHNIRDSLTLDGSKYGGCFDNPYRQFPETNAYNLMSSLDRCPENEMTGQQFGHEFSEPQADENSINVPLMQSTCTSGDLLTPSKHGKFKVCLNNEDKNEEKHCPAPELNLSEACAPDKGASPKFSTGTPQEHNVVQDNYSRDTEPRGLEESDIADSAFNKSQLQKQSRVRELLSLNSSSKQATVTLSIKQFCCEACKGIFSSVKELLQHKRSCVQKDVPDLLRCTLCAFQTCNSLALKRHKRKHSTAAYSCECCKQPFMVERNLLKHKPFCRKTDSVLELRADRGKLYKGNRRKRALSSDAVLMKYPSLSNIGCTTTEEINAEKTKLPLVSQNPRQGEVLSKAPDYGRFARLISDFDLFSQKPYACALCFFRTERTSILEKHVENHLTGCNTEPIPESARFRIVSKSTIIDSSTEAVCRKKPVVERRADEGLGPSSAGRGRSGVTRARSLSAGNVSSARARYMGNLPSSKLGFARCGTRRTRAFRCRLCGKQFSVRTLLGRHLRKIHKDDMETEELRNKS